MMGMPTSTNEPKPVEIYSLLFDGGNNIGNAFGLKELEEVNQELSEEESLLEVEEESNEP